MGPTYSVAFPLLVLAGCTQPKEAEKAPAPVQVTAVTQATIRRIVNGDGARSSPSSRRG